MMLNSEEHAKRADERIVDTLQRLYAIVIALALTSGVKILIESLGILPGGVLPTNQQGVDPRISVTLIFIAFLSTLVAFYHGMNRHLDETYIFGEHPDRRRLTLMIDIIVFVIESGLLFVMASTINKPATFLVAWSILLGIDILWSVAVFLIQRNEKPIWAVNNIGFLVAAWVCWEGLFPQNALWIALVEIGRSVTDYYFHWDYYFPHASSKAGGRKSRFADDSAGTEAT